MAAREDWVAKVSELSLANKRGVSDRVMLKWAFASLAVIISAALSGWYFGSRGYDTGYQAEHARVLVLQQKIDSRSVCIETLRRDGPPSDIKTSLKIAELAGTAQQQGYAFGYLVGNLLSEIEKCDKKGGFVTLDADAEKQWLPFVNQ